MIWPKDISFEGFQQKVEDRYSDKECVIGDPPIDAQYALDIIFKTLVDDFVQYPYLTALPESTEQVNSIMLHVILWRYSRKYRKWVKRQRKLRCKQKPV